MKYDGSNIDIYSKERHLLDHWVVISTKLYPSQKIHFWGFWGRRSLICGRKPEIQIVLRGKLIWNKNS